MRNKEPRCKLATNVLTPPFQDVVLFSSFPPPISDVTVAVVSNTGGNSISVLEETPNKEVCVELTALPAGGLAHEIEVSLESTAISACEFVLS